MQNENTENSNTGEGSEYLPMGNFDSFDDLIPDELKDAVNQMSSDDEPSKNTPDQIPQPPEPKQPDRKELPIDRIEQDDMDEDSGDLDLSSDNIDKLLEGDVDAIIKKKSTKIEENEAAPIWHENDSYKNLLKKVEYAGFSQEDLDKIILEAADKKVVDNSNYVQGLEKRNEDYSRDLELTKKENERLKRIEKAAHFDSLPEIQEKYGKAMTSDIQEIKKILDLEGANVAINSLLNAKDKAEFTDKINHIDFSDEDLLKMTNHWRSYKETLFKYNNAKTEAMKGLSKELHGGLSDDDAQVILRNSLSDFLLTDKKYGYIKNAISEGVENHEDVSKIIATAKNNFINLVRAIGRPQDHIHNTKWLSALAKYALDAEHNRHVERKHADLTTQLKDNEEKLVKVVKAYKKLAQSGKGIVGSKNGAMVRASDNKGKRSDKEDLDEFKAFLNNEIKIDDILGM